MKGENSINGFVIFVSWDELNKEKILVSFLK